MTDDTTPIPSSGHSTALPPERARIEPPPPPKRLDALPVLYLVGFVILAASLIYLWKHPGLPRNAAQEVAQVDGLRGQISALQARLAALEAKPAPAAPNLAPIEARLGELERREAASPASLAVLQGQIAALEAHAAQPGPDLRPLEDQIAKLQAVPPIDLKPLEARLAALEAKPPVDLRPLEARVAAIDARPPVDLKPIEGRLGALEAKPPVDLAPLQQRVDAVAQKEGQDQAALAKRLDAAEAADKQTDAALASIGAAAKQTDQRVASIEAAEKQTDARIASVAARAEMAGKLQGVSAALAAGQRLGDVPGAPPALARFAHAAPPTEAGLRLSFDAAAADAHRVSQPAITDNQPLLSRMWTKAQQSVTVRRGDEVLVGDPIEGVLAHARTELDAGDLAGAVRALDGLAGPAKAAMAGWVGQAQSLLDARAAIGELAARG